MPEITAVHFAIFALLFTAGAAMGWIMRGDRCARERIAVNAGWQERVEAQERDHERLQEQNRNLMQSVSQVQASQRDTSRRSKELAQSLKTLLTFRLPWTRLHRRYVSDYCGVWEVNHAPLSIALP